MHFIYVPLNANNQLFTQPKNSFLRLSNTEGVAVMLCPGLQQQQHHNQQQLSGDQDLCNVDNVDV